MGTILLFGGTTEGRRLAAFLEQCGVAYYVSVATSYGRDALPQDLAYGKIITGRMDASAAADFIRTHAISFVIDATHPYAVEATKNINAACERLRVPHIRVSRETGPRNSHAVYVPSMRDAARYLQGRDGKILLTTGSKELEAFTALSDYKKRVYVRILPYAQSIEAAKRLGFSDTHLICKKGPFSVEENKEALLQCGARYLVSKDTGKAGGFWEKARAAELLGAELVVVQKPADGGMGMEQAMAYLADMGICGRRGNAALEGRGSIGAQDNDSGDGERLRQDDSDVRHFAGSGQPEKKDGEF